MRHAGEGPALGVANASTGGQKAPRLGSWKQSLSEAGSPGVVSGWPQEGKGGGSRVDKGEAGLSCRLMYPPEADLDNPCGHPSQAVPLSLTSSWGSAEISFAVWTWPLGPPPCPPDQMPSTQVCLLAQGLSGVTRSSSLRVPSRAGGEVLFTMRTRQGRPSPCTLLAPVAPPPGAQTCPLPDGSLDLAACSWDTMGWSGLGAA